MYLLLISSIMLLHIHPFYSYSLPCCHKKIPVPCSVCGPVVWQSVPLHRVKRKAPAFHILHPRYFNMQGKSLAYSFDEAGRQTQWPNTLRRTGEQNLHFSQPMNIDVCYVLVHYFNSVLQSGHSYVFLLKSLYDIFLQFCWLHLLIFKSINSCKFSVGQATRASRIS